MSKIEQLIQQHCPDGVEYKNVKDVISEAFWIMPSTPKFVDNSDIPYITSKNLRKRSIDFTNIKYISNDDYVTISRQRPILENDILIGMIGTIGEIAKVGVFDFKFYGQNMYLLRLDESIIDINFFVHFFDSPFVKSKLNSVKNSSSQGYLKAEHIEKIQIPIPPLPIQQEIVTILDKFTALEAELEAELEARSRQYEYYRNQLLSFEDKEVEWKALGDVGEFVRGKRFVRTDMIEEGFPCIHYGEMYTHYNIYAEKSKSFINPDLAKKLRVAKYGDVIIVAAGETIEDLGKGTAWLGKEDVVIHDACFTYTSDLNPKYVSYFLRTKLFHNQIKRHISSGKISAINAKGLAQARIPVPSNEEQERIVNILDQFDALVNDIKTGLPAEIKARRAQYEYYRKKLLTFNRVTV